MMTRNPVIISYTTSSSFLLTETWKHIQTTLRAQFPLRNIHWKPPSRTSIRTIQELDIKLLPFESVRDDHVSQIPMTLLEKPLLHIYVVVCEPADLETYKNAVKKQVKEWHSTVLSRKNQEWLILHLVKGDTPVPTGGKLFQMKGTVLDKLKTDFNQDKRDRCIQVTWSTANDNPLAWGEFGNKVKDSLMTAFDATVSQREEEVRRSESQQQMPGWNFCTFFILKESLASSFEGMNLLEEALVQFDELEVSFNHIWREKNFSWFGTLISAGPEDDTLPLLSVTKKPYRDLILANTISAFDFRTFLLGRQCELLAKLERIHDITSKVAAFLARFGQRLRNIAESLPTFFVESWIYSSSLSVVQQYDAWFSSLSHDGNKQNLLYASKGELYEAARHQLDIIGVHVGHLPAKPPFSVNGTPSSNSLKTGSKSSISNKELLGAVHDREVFYKTYVDITNRAISMYTKAGRRKSALKLHGSLAALDVHRRQFITALTTYSSLPAHYAPHTWTALESYMLSRALDTHAEMDTSKDNEWLHNLLSYLKSYIEHQGSEMLIHEEDKIEYITGLVSALVEVAHKLESEIIHPDHPILFIEVTPDALLADTQDGAYLNVRVANKLPCNLPINNITVVATGRESEKYKFTATLTNLAPGQNTLRLFCPAICMGKFLVQTSEIRIEHLVFQWDHRRAAGKLPTSSKSSNAIIRVPQDDRALDVTVDQSTRIELGKTPTALLVISTGRNDVDLLKLRLVCPNVVWKYAEARAEDQEVILEGDDESLTLRDLEQDDEYHLLVPHSASSASHDLKISIEVEYITRQEPSTRRKLFLTRLLFTTLPISVNVQDFFRGSKLISKFTVSTTSHQHIRIASAELELPAGGIDGVTIASPPKSRGITVTPMQPANFLFSIDSAHGPVQESLTLVIKYRLLRTEVKELIEQVVEDTVDEGQPELLRVPLVNHIVDVLGADASWVELYSVTGELLVPDAPQDSEFGEILSSVKQILARHQQTKQTEVNWREIRIPVDIPQMHIMAAARINILATPFGHVASSRPPSLYAGLPISAELTINTSFHWGPSANDHKQQFTMRYNIEETIRDWLISGPKRGEFIAKDGGSFSTRITLLALHHGEVALPRITVSALPVVGEMTMGSMTVPSTEVFQEHGAERILILPRGGRSTFVVDMGPT